MILEVKVIRNGDNILLSQEQYTDKLLKIFGYYDFTTMNTPYDVNSKLKKNKGKSISQTQYAQIIGSLLLLMIFSRLNIAYVISRLNSTLS